jgi:hypothetical protein
LNIADIVAPEQPDSPAPEKRKPGAPKGNGNSVKMGLWPLKQALSPAGLKTIDKRSKPFRDFLAIRESIIAELGGPDVVTRQQEIAVDVLSRQIMFLDCVDAWVMAQPTVLVGRGRRKELLPVFAQRDKMVARIAGLLALVGLERRQKPVIDLAQAFRDAQEGRQ